MTEIRLYNTKTRAVEPLEPTVVPGRVGMYVCGPTVYDRAHLGNARPVVVFDVLFRLLRHVYGADNVTYVRNFTDVDDKIIARAAETGRPIDAITAETTQWYLDDMAALGALEPTEMPRATAYIPQMVAMIEALIAKGHAYAAEGHVLFDVRSYAEYGRLSGRSVDDMIAGARVEVAPYKRDPMDFVLWKPSTDDLPGWPSPWGRGRPGWHVECSAMSYALLGKSFDIHGGGNDLMFPHHENEIAQSRCAHPEGDFARIWMHNEMLQVEGKKMSKSLGNFFTVHDLRSQLSGDVMRYVLMSSHYRAPLDWTVSRVEEAKVILSRWLRLNDRFRRASLDIPDSFEPDPAILAALADDLNVPAAFTRMHELTTGNSADTEPERLVQVVGNARFLGFSLGSGTGPDPSCSLEVAVDRVDAMEERLSQMCAEIDAARAEKDFALADSIRARLREVGVDVLTTKDGTRWERNVDFDRDKAETLV
ncbi:MAG: cysteine--tRNA ligase [Rhodobacteraceae bacterium]|nr:cysteine--tRNA ligase [Paracoccaceae bacterium]